MEKAYWQRFEALLDEALNLPPASRPSFLKKACQGNKLLQADIESWLAEMAEHAEDSFMERQIALPLEALLQHALGVETVLLPKQLGAYALVRELGRGGMATVYLAQRNDGHFEDQVALKLIAQGLHGEEGIRRFLNERQILAQLRHPNIACLYDGGVNDEGQPYFVMEYVEGQPITDYCNAHQLSLKTRLGLFLQVSAALQYTHQNLVVHRDIKPSNILVTQTGHVKLLDFGIAKLLNDQEEAMLTHTGGNALTPAYAAPEQVKGELITTATDVYALGVLLYELLSGHRPYHVEGTSVEEWVRVICETEPLPPSVAVRQQKEGSDGGEEQQSVLSLSTTRGTTAVRLQRQLAGDLDTIVLKALRKEPERRYASVEALAGDIERYLEGIPILARRDTLPYRLGKFIHRHRFGMGIAVLLVLLVSGFTWQMVAEHRRAEVSAAQAREVSGFLMDLLTMSDPFSQEEKRGSRVEIGVFLERGADQIEALAGQEEVQSMLQSVLGRVYQNVGEYEKAEGFFRAALDQRLLLYGEESVEAAESMNDLGYLLKLRGGETDAYVEAEELLRKALAVRKRLLGAEHVEVASTLNNLAVTLSIQGHYAEAEALHREALVLQRKLLGKEHPQVAQTLNDQALTFGLQGDYEAAEALYREALDLFMKLMGQEHPEVAKTFNNLAVILSIQGKYPEAEVMLREALALQRKLLGEEHPEIANMLNNLGTFLRIQGNYAEAEVMHREALAMRRKLLGGKHGSVASSLNSLAEVLRLQGKYANVVALHREALALQRELWGEEHPHVASTLTRLAVALSMQGKDSEAKVIFSEALALFKKLLAEDYPDVARIMSNLGSLLADQGAYAEAEAMLLTSFETLKQTLGLDHPDTQKAIDAFIALYTAWDKPEQTAVYRAMRTEETQ